MLRILLIESDSATAHHLQSLFQHWGHSVEVMPDGLIALAELERRTTPPQLICVRVEIPRMSGYSVCNKIKRRPSLRDVPLLLISSQATPETFAQHKRLRTCANGYLAMPFAEEQLWALIEELLPGSSIYDNETAAEVPSLVKAGLYDHAHGAEKNDTETADSSHPAKQQRASWQELYAVQDTELGTAQLRSGDVVSDSGAYSEAVLSDSDILDIAELSEDDALELSEDDLEESKDWGQKSNGNGSYDQPEQTIIPAREVAPHLPTKVVMVRRGQDAGDSLYPPATNHGGLLHSNQRTPQIAVPAGWDTAKKLQQLWGESLAEESSDSMASTMIAGQSPKIPGYAESESELIKSSGESDDSLEEDTFSGSQKSNQTTSSVQAVSLEDPPKSNGSGSLGLFMKVQPNIAPSQEKASSPSLSQKTKTPDSKSPEPKTKTPDSKSPEPKAKTPDSKSPEIQVGASDFKPPEHATKIVPVVRANGHGAILTGPSLTRHTPISTHMTSTQPLDFSDTSHSSRIAQDIHSLFEEAADKEALHSPKTTTPQDPSQQESWRAWMEENQKLLQTVEKLEADNQRLRHELSSLTPSGQDDSLSAFIAKQLDELDHHQELQGQDKHDAVVVIKNFDVLEITESDNSDENDPAWTENIASLKHRLQQQEHKYNTLQEQFEQEKQAWQKRLLDLECLLQPDHILQMQLSEYRDRLEQVRKENRDLQHDIEKLHQQLGAVVLAESAALFSKQGIEKSPHQQRFEIPDEDTASQGFSPEQAAIVASLRGDVEEKSQSIADLCERIRELEDIHHTQSQLLDEQAHTLRQFEIQQQQWEQQQQSYTKQTDLLQTWEQRYQTLEEEYETLQRVFQTKEIELEQLDDANRELYQRMEAREQEQRELRAELAAFRIQLQGQTATDDELLSQTAEKEKELQLLRHELNDLGEQYDKLERSHSALALEHKRVSEELKLRNNALLAMDGERNSLAEEIIKAKQLDTNRTKETKELNLQIGLLEKEIESLQEEVETIAVERNRFRDEMLQLSNELDASREEMRNIRERDGGLRDEAEGLQDQVRRLKQELTQSQNKAQQINQHFKGLEEEIVSLRQKNLALEQKQFEINEQSQRLQQEREDLARQLAAEKSSRQHHISQIDQYEERMNQMLSDTEAWQEKQKIWYTQKQEYQQICEDLRHAVDELTSRNEQFEASEQLLQAELQEARHQVAQQQETWYNKLREQELLKETQLSEHQQELLDMQADWEHETQQQLQNLRWDIETHWQQKYDQDRKAWEQQHNQSLQQHEEAWNQQREEWHTIHAMEVERIHQEYQDQLAEQKALHHADMEQLQQEWRTEQTQTLSQLEEDNRRLRKQLRDMEQEYRQNKLMQQEEWRAETERRTSDMEKQIGLRYQAMLEGLQQREAELEKALDRLKREQNQQQTQREEVEIELEHMRNQVADLETLRRHEKNELVRLKKEREQQEIVLQERIDELEKALQERRSQASELYQRLKSQEAQKESTAQALRNALSLLGNQAAQRAESESEHAAEREEKALAEIAKLAKLDF